MNIWYYGINSIHKTASIHLERKTWWVWVLEVVSDFLCDKCPAISFPPIPIRLSRKDAKELNDNKRWTNFKDSYGDLSQWWHVKIHDPVFQFCTRKTNTESLEITYDKAHELFYEGDKRFWDEEVKIAKEWADDSLDQVQGNS